MPATQTGYLRTFSAVCAVVLVLLGIFSAQGARSMKITNHHWSGEGCTVCHGVKGKAIDRIPLAKVDEMCLRCHDGKTATHELHPVGVVMRKGQFNRPDGWPLKDDKIGCLTCHDVRLLCQPSPLLPLINPAFLRGKQNGDLSAFCANCHQSMPYQNAHPHIMLRADNTLHENVCLLCHTSVLDRTGRMRAGKPELRSPETVLCKTCHPLHADYFEPGHLGAKIPPDILAYMSAREATGPATRPGAALIARMKRSGTQPVKMVPDADGKLTCTTCHNPHQEGLFPADSPLADNAMQVTGPDQVRSPVRSREFCLRCHNK